MDHLTLFSQVRYMQVKLSGDINYVDEGYIDIGEGSVIVTHPKKYKTWTLEFKLRLNPKPVSQIIATSMNYLLEIGDFNIMYTKNKLIFNNRSIAFPTTDFNLCLVRGTYNSIDLMGKVYINGELVLETDLPKLGDFTVAPPNPGLASLVGVCRLRGMRIYNRPLADQEVNANVGNPRPISHGLVGYYKTGHGRKNFSGREWLNLSYSMKKPSPSCMRKSRKETVDDYLDRDEESIGVKKMGVDSGKTRKIRLVLDLLAVLNSNPEYFNNLFLTNHNFGQAEQEMARRLGRNNRSELVLENKSELVSESGGRRARTLENHGYDEAHNTLDGILSNPMKSKLLVTYLKSSPKAFLELLESRTLKKSQMSRLRKLLIRDEKDMIEGFHGGGEDLDPQLIKALNLLDNILFGKVSSSGTHQRVAPRKSGNGRTKKPSQRKPNVGHRNIPEKTSATSCPSFYDNRFTCHGNYHPVMVDLDEDIFNYKT